MKTIAITGGIGSGKSTVSDYLICMGYTVIDADRMSREMTSSGGKAIPYIIEKFGPGFIEEDGSLNRQAMRDLVFHSPDQLKMLEEGTTKVVIEDIEKIKSERESEGDECLFFDIPLLFEKHQEDNYDYVWVVTADYEIRASRVMARDNIDPEIINLIMNTQESEEYRISRADVVIYNNGTVEDLYHAVDEALSEILS